MGILKTLAARVLPMLSALIMLAIDDCRLVFIASNKEIAPHG